MVSCEFPLQFLTDHIHFSQFAAFCKNGMFCLHHIVQIEIILSNLGDWFFIPLQYNGLITRYLLKVVILSFFQFSALEGILSDCCTRLTAIMSTEIFFWGNPSTLFVKGA